MLDTLKNMEYPGRGIIVGNTMDDEKVVIYFITGRSGSSKARRLKVSDGNQFVYIEVTNQKLLDEGDPALLVYNAIALEGDNIIVSNGGQTELIRATSSALRLIRDIWIPKEILKLSFKEPFYVPKKDGSLMDLAGYEPDKPNYTPRISAYINEHGYFAFSVIISSSNGVANKEYYQHLHKPGMGRLLSTYTGENIEPLPSFRGASVEIEISGFEPQEIADSVYESLGEFRVGVACLIKRKDGTIDIKTKNLHD